MRNTKSISVVYLTLNAEPYINNFIKNILNQSLKPQEILVIDSESTDNTIKIAENYSEVKIINIKRNNFDHGGTRHLALEHSKGEIVLFFSQDAEIIDSNYINNIVRNFNDESVAMVYGRQVPRENAPPYEQLIRSYNYPTVSKVKTKNDISTLGIKCFYMSDVCSAYRKDIYYTLGGFEKLTLTNEDMLIATKAIFAGYKVVYDSKAVVMHSHNYTFSQELRRNFDVAAFLQIYSKFYSNININSEGVKLVKYVLYNLTVHCNFLSIMIFIYICIGKYFGNRLGKVFDKIPHFLVLYLTTNKNFWSKFFNSSFPHL